MRRAIIAFFAAAFFAASPAWAQTSAGPPPPPENVAAARQLIQVMRATDQFKAILPTIIQGLRPAVVQGRPEMEKDFDTIMPIIINGATQHLNELADKLADIYASNFSVDEIHDLIAFYHTPTGQKLLDRQSVVARESMAAGQHFGQTLVMELKEQITDELRKRGRPN
jgi:hypothetical protein